MPDLIIEAATAADYPEILALNEAAIPAVNSIPESKLAALHRQSTYLGVARNGAGEMAGFLLALPESADYDSLNFGYFKRTYPAFVYIDRIVVSDRIRRAGVGAALYADLAGNLPRHCRLLTCEVNLRPPNPTSLAFHERMGFAPVGEQDTEGGQKRVCLMAKPIG
jgi:predicted GNAT superfamily acetyltransferase